MPATADANVLGRYLRVRRALVRPGAARVPGQGNRRVPGLRREEVAFLAGVSSDYYVRLEQGRDRHPSDQVLLAIARALQLDEDATAYLLQLAKPPSPRSKRTRRPEKVSDGIRTLISSWPITSAYVHGKYMDVLAANNLATALCPFITPGRNAILDAFTGPEMSELRPDWDVMTARAVPHLRSIAAGPGHLPRPARQRLRRTPAPARQHQRTGSCPRLPRPDPGQVNDPGPGLMRRAGPVLSGRRRFHGPVPPAWLLASCQARVIRA